MKTIIYLVPLALMLGCGDVQQKSEALQKANQVHIESMDIATSVEKSLDSLRRENIVPPEKSRLDSIARLVAEWEEAVIEVPGFEHAHQHTEGHQHKPAPQMTDESMLEYQLNAREAIESIRMQLNNAHHRQ
ncbi:hypothetical protein [Dyadobacter crusticola]|uniref:hypothetical protein n=1 Tax=Dyadobacter crusticola TaxID=292407 RepID=UPI0004E22B0B|nr:hypothetical protein [Dyadobacter crusticola]